MSSTIDQFELLNNIKTHVLKVHINCQGCVVKVRKLLCKIEGVYNVDIDAEEQKITVIGSVECATLIKQLVRAGKHAQQIWSSDQIEPPSPPRNHNIQRLQLMGNEQIEHNNKNHGIGLDGSDGYNDHPHHQFGRFEDSVSFSGGGGGGSVAAPMPLYYPPPQYFPPADFYQFYQRL